ncbi:MAG: hypothetical protein LUQ65_10085 [Candidatus Helarchaeota archaeon]|nr:hypothetical protein [Candidatus Helarchaeota archaeon]
MEPILIALSIISVILVVFSGLSGHLIHLGGEKFQKLNKWHTILGTCTTALVVILVICLLAL